MSTRALSVPSTGPAQPNQAPSKGPANPMAPLAALCAIARFHQVAADPATLAHQLGLSANQILTTADLIHAARHLGLKAKLSRTAIDRLSLTPLPALALMQSKAGAVGYWQIMDEVAREYGMRIAANNRKYSHKQGRLKKKNKAF